MKEATGEANMTIVTVVLIGIVSAAAAFFIPKLMNSAQNKACCTSNGGNWKNGACVDNDGHSVSTDCDAGNTTTTPQA